MNELFFLCGKPFETFCELLREQPYKLYTKRTPGHCDFDGSAKADRLVSEGTVRTRIDCHIPYSEMQ